MGRDLRGKELGVGISQRSGGFTVSRRAHWYVTKALKG